MTSKIAYALLWLISRGLAVAAAPASMQFAYDIDLPGYALHLSLPPEIGRNMPSDRIEKSFEPRDPSFQRNGFREIGGWSHDFNGPVWIGAYGSLKFHFMIRRIDEKSRGRITTSRDLESYLREIVGPMYGFNYEQTMLNGANCTRRFRSTFDKAGTSGEKKEELEIFSFPINDQMFLEMGFNIIEWVPGRTTAWKKRAEILKEEIKATIIINPMR